MKSINEIREDYNKGKYSPTIPYPSKQRFVENDDETIRQNNERKELLLVEYKKKLQEYKTIEVALWNQLIEDCLKTEIGVLNLKQVELVWNLAYEQNHSCMSDVFPYFEELCDFVREILKAGKEVENE